MSINQTIPTFRSCIHSAAQIIMRSSGGSTYSGISNANLLTGSCKSPLSRFWGQMKIQSNIIFLSDISQLSDKDSFKLSSS